MSSLDNSYARTLGITDVKSGIPQTINGVKGDFFGHLLSVKIGNLKPVSALFSINVAAQNFKVNILGVKTMLLFERVTFQGGYITFIEKGTAPVVKKQAAYGHANINTTWEYANSFPAWARYGKRI
jgi:hypothetical protein